MSVTRYPAPRAATWHRSGEAKPKLIGLLSMAPLPLTRPIKPKNHAPLHTVSEVCAYVVSLPDEIATMRVWVRVAALALKAREHPTPAALDELTGYVELALFLLHRLDLTAHRSALDVLLDRARDPERTS